MCYILSRLDKFQGQRPALDEDEDEDKDGAGSQRLCKVRNVCERALEVREGS